MARFAASRGPDPEATSPEPRESPASPGTTGILTLHKCINYGSYWQTRCLLEALRTRGVHAVVLEHHSWRVNRAEWRHALRPTTAPVARPADVVRYATKLLRFSRALARMPRSPRFPMERPHRMVSLDLVIVGSDEVWNFSHPWYGGAPLFFGVGVQADRICSYAASFGNFDGQRLDSWWAARLHAFRAMSVRDANSRRIIEASLGRTPRVVLDPCFLAPPRPEPRHRGPHPPFLAVYGHSFSPAFAQTVRRWATSRRLPLVSVGYRNAWADVQWLSAGPDDFARCMACADGVATNFYHGCVFALLHGKPFVCEDSPYRSLKIRSLMELVGSGARLVAADVSAHRWGTLLDTPPDADVHSRIARLRETSERFLDRALDCRSA